MAILNYGCSDNITEEASRHGDIHDISISIDIDNLLSQAKPGDEVSNFVKMNGVKSKTNVRNVGTSNLIVLAASGDQLVWVLDDDLKDKISITKFEFELVSGENFLDTPGGSLPQINTEGNWEAQISPDAVEGSEMKYSVYFEVEGGDSFWWDPVVQVRSTPE